jgi:hypothetical protein
MASPVRQGRSESRTLEYGRSHGQGNQMNAKVKSAYEELNYDR